MNWDAVGAIADAVGAAGVIITLAYLAVQIRQNTRAIDENRRFYMAQSYQSRAMITEESTRVVADSSYLASVFIKYRETGLESLNPEERFRFLTFQVGRLARLDSIHYQFQQGFIDEEYYENEFKRLIRESGQA